MSSTQGMSFEIAARLIANFAKGAPSWNEEDEFYQLDGKISITPLEQTLSDLTPKHSNDSAVLDFLTIIAQQDDDWKQYIDSNKSYKKQIDTSIWAQIADGPISGDRWKDPPITMDDISHVLSTAAFCLPGGAAFSSGLSFGSKYLNKWAQRQTTSFNKAIEYLFDATELDRQTNPYDSLETWISQDVDEGFLNQTVEPVRAMANALVERLNQCIYTKTELDENEQLCDKVTNSMVYTKTGSMIALKSTMSKEAILHGVEGLDIVLTLIKAPEWLTIVGGESSFYGNNISEGLAYNPSKAAATYAIFVSISITIQKALQVYAWLTLLPEEAFGDLNWDGKVWVEDTNENLETTKVRKDFDIFEALYNSKDSQSSDDSAWTILEQLTKVILSPSGSFMRRFDDGRKIWNIFLQRILNVDFKDNQLTKRNGIWYYGPDGSIKRRYDLDHYDPASYSCGSTKEKDKFFNKNVNDKMNLDEILMEETKGKHQIIMLDTVLNKEQALDSVGNNFHTHLKLSLWFLPKCPKKPKNLVSLADWATTTKPFNATERGIIIEEYNKGVSDCYTKHYTFPLVACYDSSKGTAKTRYPDVFWITSNERPSESLGSFLNSNEGRWTVGWLGLVLNNYAQAYGIRFDLERQTNTFMVANAALRIHKTNAEHITQLLDDVNKFYDKTS